MLPMPALDLPLFLALNATAATPQAIIATARWLSQDLPVFAGLMLLLELARGCLPRGGPSSWHCCRC